MTAIDSKKKRYSVISIRVWPIKGTREYRGMVLQISIKQASTHSQ